MALENVLLMATFTAPERLGTNPRSLLWLLPLAAAIAVVYKATKISKITARNFLKQTLTLFGSIVVFIIATALGLYVLAWLIGW
jgi:hypothetical protein